MSELDILTERMNILRDAWAEFGLSLSENLGSAMDSIIHWYIMARRDLLKSRLEKYIPEEWASWISVKCPKKWLPNFDFGDEDN